MLYVNQADSSSIGGKIVSDLGIIASEELVGAGSHVNVIVFSLCSLEVKEPVDRFVLRCILENAFHHLKQGFS